MQPSKFHIVCQPRAVDRGGIWLELSNHTEGVVQKMDGVEQQSSPGGTLFSGASALTANGVV